MSKKENEAVVNRFLLSTLYFIVFGFALFMLNNVMRSARTFMYYNTITYALMVIGIVGIIWFAALKFLGKINLSSALYYVILFLLIAFSGAFIKYYYILPGALKNIFMSVSTRCKALGILAGLIYVYEVVMYFLKVNK